MFGRSTQDRQKSDGPDSTNTNGIVAFLPQSSHFRTIQIVSGEAQDFSPLAWLS